MEGPDYYAILGVARDADEPTIKLAYRRLARKYHPDVSEEGDAEERFKAIREAYETLSDPQKREFYDATGKAGEEQLQREAESAICGMIISWIQATSGEGDLRAHMNRALTAEFQTAINNVSEGERVLEVTRRGLARIHYKGKRRNLVAEALEKRIAELEKMIALSKRNVDRVRLGMTIINDYEYDWTAPTYLRTHLLGVFTTLPPR